MRFLSLLLVFFMSSAFAIKEVIPLGDSTVTIDWQQKEGPMYVHLHESETTAWQAIRHQVGQRNGSYLHLHQSGQRNICFKQDGQRYCFDPNRIFTHVGIKKTLTEHSQRYHANAHQQVMKLSQRIKAIIGQKSVIAVHNNQEYSMRDYLPKHSLASDAAALHWHNTKQYRDFLLITQDQLWPSIINSTHNAILQASNSRDDGSLSIWMANRPYINCEAGYDHLNQQLKQLDMATKLMG